MTPKEKAKELVDRYMRYVYCYMGSGMLTNDYDEIVALSNAKQCALICVDEILKSNPIHVGDDFYFGVWEQRDKANEYWQQVKTEIEKL